MKKNLSSIIETMSEENVDILIQDLDLTDGFDDLSADNIKNKVRYKMKKQRGRHKIVLSKRLIGKVACFALIIAFALTALSAAVFAVEYNNAVKFFDENNISTEGLSKLEMVVIYRDITTRSFTYDKTGEVIQKAIYNGKIKGYDVFGGNITSFDVEGLWNYYSYNGRKYVVSDGVTAPYEDTEFKLSFDYDNDKRVYDYYYLEKYADGEHLWTATFPKRWISGYDHLNGFVAVYGVCMEPNLSKYDDFFIGKVDGDGNILWQSILSCKEKIQSIEKVFLTENGKVHVFVRYNSTDIGFYNIDENGTCTVSHRIPIGESISDIERFKDGYIACASISDDDSNFSVLLFDSKGQLSKKFEYGNNDHQYIVTDMIEFGGNIYISAYSIDLKKVPDGFGIKVRKKYGNNTGAVSDKYATKLWKKYCSAVLFICDPDTGVPQKFFSASGALGAELGINDNNELVWSLQKISKVEYSPQTSSFTFKVYVDIHRYAFDLDGLFIKQEKTDEEIMLPKL